MREWFTKPRFWGGYSVLGLTNILFFQWFFIRLQGYKDWESSQLDWSFSFIGFIVPLTGWWTNYIWVKKVWYK